MLAATAIRLAPVHAQAPAAAVDPRYRATEIGTVPTQGDEVTGEGEHRRRVVPLVLDVAGREVPEGSHGSTSGR